MLVNNESVMLQVNSSDQQMFNDTFMCNDVMYMYMYKEITLKVECKIQTKELWIPRSLIAPISTNKSS